MGYLRCDRATGRRGGKREAGTVVEAPAGSARRCRRRYIEQ